MQINQIRSFLAIAQAGSINKAAQILHLTQAPLSRQMQALEDELGVKLFIRGNKEIELTDEGHILAERGREILDLVNNTRQEIIDFNKGATGTLNIGSVPTIGALIIPNIITKYKKKHPHVQFKVWEGESLRIIELLEKGIIDIGFIRPPFKDNGYNILNMQDEPLCLVFNNRFFTFDEDKSLDIVDIHDKPILSIQKYLPLVQEAYAAQGYIPNIFCQSDTIVPVLAWAKAGLGLAITPLNAYTTIAKDPELSARSFKEPLPMTGSAVVWKKNRYLSNICKNFIEELNS